MMAILLMLAQLGDVDQAVLENRYDDAVSSLRKQAKGAAARRDRGELEAISVRVAEIRRLEREYRKVRRHDGEDDPASRRIMGRFECFVKGAWEKGLPLLRESDDAFLSAIAEQELEGGSPLKIANSWWTGSTELEANLGLTGATGTIKERVDRKTAVFWRGRMEERAIHWYRRAWPSLTGDQRSKVRELVLRYVGVEPGAFPQRPQGQARGWHPIQEYWGASLVSGAAFDGKMSILLTRAPDENKGGFSAVQSLQGRAVEGARYVARVRVLSNDTDTSGIVEVRFFGADGQPIQGFTSGFPPDYPFWKEVTVECEAPEGSASVAVDIRSKMGGGFIFVDAASLVGPDGELLKNGSFEGR